MAPNAITNRQRKKPSVRLVQPALPLIPGKTSQKAKPVAAETGPDAAGLEPLFTADGGVNHEQTSPVEIDSRPSSLQNGDINGKEISSAAEDSLSSPTADAPEEVATQTSSPKHNQEDEKKEVDNGLAIQDATHDAGGGAATESSNNDAVSPAVELPTHQPDAEQENGVVVNGHIETFVPGPAGDNDSEPQELVASAPQLPEQTEIAAPGYANGIGSSHATPTEHDAFLSQQEQITQRYEVAQSVSIGDGLHATTMNGYHPPSTASLGLNAPLPRSFNALPSLAEHLLHINATKEGADIVIQINASNAQQFACYSHSVILFRSLRLRRLMTRQQQSANNYGSNVITLYPARYVMPHAFEAALRYLYSDTVLGKDFFVQPHSGADYQTVRVHNLDYLMSYWASGIELGVEPVSMCAERLLAHYLDWDILEITYKYAIELANSPLSSQGKNMTGSDYLVASSTIVKLILQFLASHIDINSFKLDTVTAHNLIPSRLPQLDDARPKHNPALAAMVFGSMPSSADMSPSSPQSEILPTASTFKDTVASNILLNVDFENLFAFNNFVQAPTIRDAATTKLMTDLVNEREARRQKIHSSRVQNKDRMADSAAWEPVGIRESVLDTNVLHRDRVGFLASSK